MAQESPPAGTLPETKPWACTSCAQKKIKCDRIAPICSHCAAKARLCEYRAPPPPNRKKRKPEANLEVRMLTRIMEYEKILSSRDIAFEPFAVTERNYASPGDSDVGLSIEPEGMLVRKEEGEENGQLWDQGNESQRYYSHGLLVMLAKDFRDGVRIEPEALSESVCEQNQAPSPFAQDPNPGQVGTSLCSTGMGLSQQDLMPDSLLLAFVSKLWPVYMESVQPINMVLHAPSMRSLIDRCTVGSTTLTKQIEALLAAVCASALCAMTDVECENIFSTRRSLLLAQFQSMAQQRLVQAGFYDHPSLGSLQTFIILLVSLHGKVSSHTFAVNTAVAIRTAAALGLHREGTKLHSPPFETELRRRLWWYIVSVDSRAVELAGMSSQILPSFDSQLPLNINDEDLQPGMKDAPQPRTGATQMLYARARYEMLKVMLRCSRLRQVGIAAVPGDIKFDGEIDRLESHLEGHFLRFCDPVIPLHVLTTATMRLGVCKMRLMWTAHLQHDVTIYAPEVAQKMRIVEYDNFLLSTKQTARFAWHVRSIFPWGALMQLLDIVSRSYPVPADKKMQIQRIWDMTVEALDNHPETLDLDPTKPAPAPRPLQLGMIYTAVQAWEARAKVTGEPIERAPIPIHNALRQHAAGEPIGYDRTGAFSDDAAAAARSEQSRRSASQNSSSESGLFRGPYSGAPSSRPSSNFVDAARDELNSIMNAPNSEYASAFDLSFLKDFNMNPAPALAGDYSGGMAMPNFVDTASGWQTFGAGDPTTAFNFDFEGIT